MKKIFLFVFSITFLFAEEKVIINNNSPGALLVSSNIHRTILEFNGGDFTKSSVIIEGGKFFHLNFQGEPTLLEKGNPQLPKMVRSIIIPDNAKMKVKILETEYTEFDLAVAPSKGSITRNINPETIPYTFSDVYKTNALYPGTLAELSDPYIMRDIRGMTVTVYPFRYNPISNTLRVYTKILVEIIEDGVDDQNVKTRQNEGINKHFTQLYSEHFINYDMTRYDTVVERGRMIVIAYGDFMDAVQPYVDWKNQKGIQTDLYDVYEMGSNSTGIKNFIQSEYDSDSDLCFVQLVGDHAQVPTIMVSNGGGGGSDPSFALLDGNDSYPEIFVGRFSASSLSHVQTQIERTIYYERDITEGSWLHKGSGIASNQGPGDDGEYDNQHSDVIRQKLLDYNYTEIDQIYDPSGTDQQGIDAINDGRGIINYTGHGSVTSWGNGASLNINQVNNLENDWELPHVISVGCVNGSFENNTCFAEAWLRATNNSNGAPTGAVAFYASTVNQYWNEPMRAQDHTVDLLVGYNYSNNQPVDKKYTIGGLWYNGSCNMMDVYGSSGIDMFLTWIIFGDASLDIRSDIPMQISASHTGTLFIGDEGYEVITNVPDALVAISDNGTLLGSGYTDESGDVVVVLSPPPDSPTELTLTVTGYNRVTKIEPVSVIAPSGPFLVVLEYSATTSDDDVIEYGEDVTLSVTLENIGIETAANVMAYFTSDDTFIEIDNGSASFGNVAPNSTSTVSSACTFLVSTDVPDEHHFQLLANIQSSGETWEEIISLTAYAPIISVGGFSVINDDNGNGNLDPGETADLNVILSNSGGADGENINALLSCDNPNITITENQDQLGEIEDSSTGVVSYAVSASSNIPLGEGVIFDIAVTADNNYTNTSSFIVTVGLALEDFESGGFTSYPWEFSGYNIQWPGVNPIEDYNIVDTLANAEWGLDSDEYYSGSFSSRSAEITHNQASIMHITMDVIEDNEISFYYRVACEYSPSGDFFYDGLIFSIDGNIVEHYQPTGNGQSPWTHVSHPVSSGLHTFSWAYVKDGSDGGSYIDEDAAYVDYIIFPASTSSGPSDLQVAVEYMAGWNMVGLPVNLGDTHYESLFPDAVPFTLYSFDGGYELETNMELGTGYLLRFTQSGNSIITGLPIDDLTLSITEGWNLISGISYLLDINAIIDPDNLIIPGTIYGFEEGGYALVETMDPGYGYWVRSTGDGEITLSSSAPSGRIRTFQKPEDANSLVLNNTTLYFGKDVPLEEQFSYSMPPKPPVGAFDARFKDGWRLIKDYGVIEVMPTTETLTIAYDIMHNTGEHHNWALTSDNGKEYLLKGTGEITVPSAQRFTLERKEIVPIEYTLHQNYPNPFNPITTLRYDLPSDALVTLSIYDMLGREITQLVNTAQEAGFKSVQWDAADSMGRPVSAGVYLYQIQAGEFVQTKKMVLLK